MSLANRPINLLVSLLALCCLTTSAAAVPSLFRNGGFERDGSWTIGQYTRIVAESPHSGYRCLRADGDRGAAAEQAVWSVQAGMTVSVSGWIRTREIATDRGGFAFLALYEYDRQGQLVRFVDFAKVTGTTPWTLYEHTAKLTSTTEYVVVRAGIHAAQGTAWFDDVNLVAGDHPQPWSEPSLPTARPLPYRAAILDDPSLPVRGAATPVRTFRTVFASLRVPLTSLRVADIENGALSPERFDLFIVPTGATFPATCRRALLSFLTAGGDLLCTGGYAFDHLVLREGGKWVPYRKHIENQTQRARSTLIENGGFEDGAEHWQTGGPACAVDDSVAASGRYSGRVTVLDAGTGARWTHLLDVEPGKTYLVGANVRYENVRGSHYAFLAVYQYDAAGELLTFRDFAQITGSHDWTRREAVIAIHPKAARVLFHAGLYLASGTLWIDDVTCGALPAEERINAHYGEPGDALRVAPGQLTLFSPDQPLSGVRGVGVWPGWPTLQIAGSLTGYDATAQLRQNARWQPIVEARDARGNLSGAVGALVTHRSGPFGGSRWALFGVTNRDIFATTAGLEILRRTVDLLAQPVALAALSTNYAMYEQGEVVQMRLDLMSPRGRAMAPAHDVEVIMDAPGRSTAPLYRTKRRIPAGQSLPTQLTFTYKVRSGTPDFVRVRTVIRDARGAVSDWIETGFCVRDPRVVERGPRIRYHDNGFSLQVPGRPEQRATLFGTDTYANMFLSPSRSPLTWYRDLAAMREYGLHMFENLQYTPTGYRYTEEEWRRMDALIQLSQRFGLPYMAGLLIGHDVVVDDATLQAQAEMCRSFAWRYRHVPGLIYYLDGDFQLQMKDIPDIRRLWNDFLRQRYGSDAAFREAWGDEAVPEPLGQVPVADYVSAKPFSVRVRDIREFQTHLVTRWVSALTSAIREADTEHPITSEYYQRPSGGIDSRLTMDGMDAANFGYFGPPREDIAQLLATIKWNDMRRAGKTMNIGEFGVKTHDAWTVERGGSHYHIARTEEEQRRQLWWIVHAAIAYDVTKIQNWCWSDDPDGVFPWGVAYNNPLRPKPVLRLWRNLRAVSDLMPHAYQPAETVFVMPDSWRLGAPEAAAWKGIATALECLLATNVRFDVVGEAQVADMAPGSVRLVVAPFASRMPPSVQARLLTLAEAGATVYISIPPTSGPLADALRAGTQAGIADWMRVAVGQGRVLAAPEAWEAMPGRDVFVGEPEITADPQRNLYLRLPAIAGVEPPVRLEAPAGVWRATARTANGRTLVAVFRRDQEPKPLPVTVRLSGSGHTIRWPEVGAWPSLVVLDANGNVLAATGTTPPEVNGRKVAPGAFRSPIQ